MKISMYARFALEKKDDDGNIIRYMPEYVSPGGYCFIIQGMEIPFDWDACSGDYLPNEEFEFQTGYGPFFNDFEISDCCDDDYIELGIKREDITAKFLSEVTEINEFYIYFGEECIDEYTLNIKEICFIEMESNMKYFVSPEVIKQFNDSMLIKED